jgi:hypothetical protein
MEIELFFHLSFSQSGLKSHISGLPLTVAIFQGHFLFLPISLWKSFHFIAFSFICSFFSRRGLTNIQSRTEIRKLNL